MTKYLGIDIGGTTVKLGIVESDGNILHLEKVETPKVFQPYNLLEGFKKEIKKLLDAYPEINKVGIGIPGTLTKDRKSIIELNNIPILNGIAIITELEKSFAGIQFYAENDANAAALGEYHFCDKHEHKDFFFITLGTGVGGAMVLDGKLFLGARGNAMEIHNNPCEKGHGYEYFLGKKGWIKEARRINQEVKSIDEKELDTLDPKGLYELAKFGDPVANKVLKIQGKRLGELIVSSIRFFDIRHIYIGGGVASTYKYMKKSCEKTLSEYLEPYYTKELVIEKSKLKNKAGILGAASLCLQ